MTNGIARGAGLKNSAFYMGSLMSFLLTRDETEGRLAIVEAVAKIGNEPPPHFHEYESETFFILEGAAEFFIEGKADSMMASSGDLVFLPQGKAHAIYFRSSPFRVLVIAHATGEHEVALDSYFKEIACPASSMALPAESTTYIMLDPEAAIATAARHGVQILTDAEAAQRLPNYPGFGANLRA